MLFNDYEPLHQDFCRFRPRIHLEIQYVRPRHAGSPIRLRTSFVDPASGNDLDFGLRRNDKKRSVCSPEYYCQRQKVTK